jgi:HTH-type transcriptional regulator/antitoxin HigA
MAIKPIRGEKDLALALKRIDELIDATPGSEEYDELEVLSVLVEAYEDVHTPIPSADPIETIKFRMDQLHLSQSDMADCFGGKNRVSEVLAGKRSLTITMIRNLHHTLNIPCDLLVGAAPTEQLPPSTHPTQLRRSSRMRHLRLKRKNIVHTKGE